MKLRHSSAFKFSSVIVEVFSVMKGFLSSLLNVRPHPRVVGRVAPCAPPQPATNPGAHGVTHPALRFIGRAEFFSSSAIAAIGLVIFFAGSAGRAAIPPAEQLLPPDTLFFVTVPDCVKMRGIARKIPLLQFWNDPAMKPFRDKCNAKWQEEWIRPLEGELGVKLAEFMELPQGQLTYAITKENWNAQDANRRGELLLLDAREKSSQLKTNLARLRNQWIAAGKPLRIEKIRGAEFSIVPMLTNAVPQALKQFFPQYAEIEELGRETPKPAPGEVVVGQHDSLLIVANSIKTVDKIMARLTGGATACLAEDAMFEANRLALFRDAPLYAWLNGKVLFDVLAKVPPDKPNPEAPNPLPTYDTAQVVAGTGFGALRSAAFVFRDAPDGTMFEFFFDTPENSRKGLFKTFAFEPKDCSPPPFVPADVVKFQRVRMDGQKFTAAMEKTLGEISPNLLSTYSFLLTNGNDGAKIDDPNYDLRRDLFGNLGDDLITYEKAPRGNSPTEIESPPTLYLLGSAQADKLLASLKGALIIPSPEATKPRSREFLGRKIFTIKMLEQAAVSGKPSEYDLHYAASGGYVALSADASMLEEYLRSNETPANTLRETAGLAEAAQKVGGQSTGWFVYENFNESMRLMFATLKQNLPPPTNNPSSLNALEPLTSNLPYAGPEKSFREWMDFSSLPPFEQVSKYFHFTVHSGSANVDGITLRYFSPTPPGFKK